MLHRKVRLTGPISAYTADAISAYTTDESTVSNEKSEHNTGVLKYAAEGTMLVRSCDILIRLVDPFFLLLAGSRNRKTKFYVIC